MDVMQTIEVITPTIRRVTMTGDAAADGTTWENAMTLQAALASTFVPGDQLWIAAGTYKPGPASDGDDATDDRRAKFIIPAGVRVYGGFDPATDNAIDSRTGAATILSGDLAGDDLARTVAGYAATRDENSYTVVAVTGVNVVLDGLTITAGDAGLFGAGLTSSFKNIAVTNCTFTNNTARDGGGAFFSETATLTGCIFTGNMATESGGGVFFNRTSRLTSCTFMDNTAIKFGGGAYFFDPATLTNCVFTGNMTTSTSDLGGGGAFFGLNSTGTTLTGVTFTGNMSANAGGGAYFRAVTLTGCTFMGNTATSDGGGAYFRRTATLTGSTFMGNTATVNGGGAYFRDTATPTLTNGVFAGNTATENGGGLYLQDRGTVINTTLYKNMATINGGGIYVAYNLGGDFNLQNSLLLGNTAMDDASGHQLYINNTNATYVASLQHNLLAGGAAGIVYATPGAMGISEANTVDQTGTAAEAAAAVFASTTASEANYLRLKEGSPAANAGNNDFLNNGTPDNTKDDVTTDVAGDARIQGGTVDLGAYESDIKATQTIDFTLVADRPGGR